MQTIIFDGHIIPNTNGKNNFMYFEGKEGKSSFVVFAVSTRRPYAKKDENGYYPTDIIPCKAFGATADFIHNYFQGRDAINIMGHFSYDQGGTKPDGTTYPSRLSVICDNVYFPESSKRESAGNTQTVKTSNNTTNAAPANRAINPFG